MDGLEEERLYRALKTLTVDWSKLVGFDWRRSSVRALIDELTRRYPPLGTSYAAAWGRRGRRSVMMVRVWVWFPVNGGVGGRESFL